ncbi:hypothetical protein [Microbulbifer rhizosphaerae]|uniref:Uncharacterized protein n=1 Tax=Microbulbifer rhizosphaerae TaxID=1562603 RepID=A0A7W4WE96_9GAMM|nr:hypothetical protein [Microbulbifer rhizosphaerae]MBB3062611.1 hypothetical protein [Microbulbifer rhizosphaerae]
MPFNHITASQQIDPTSCGCCTTAWGLKVLHENNLTVATLTLPSGANLASQTQANYWNYGDTRLERDLFPMRVGGRAPGLTMPSNIAETILRNANGITLVLETSPGIETIFNKVGYGGEVTTLKNVVANYANASHVYMDSYIRRPLSTHLFSIGLMGRTDGTLHWLFQEASNGSWCDPGLVGNRHWFKAHTAYTSAAQGTVGSTIGVNLYVYN